MMSAWNAAYAHDIVEIQIYHEHKLLIYCLFTGIKKQKRERIKVKINKFIWDYTHAGKPDNLKETSSQIHTTLYLYSACKGKE